MNEKEHHKILPGYLFIYLFIIRLLYSKHLDKSIKAQDTKEIQIPKHIIKNYTSSCQETPYELSKCTNLITQQ